MFLEKDTENTKVHRPVRADDPLYEAQHITVHQAVLGDAQLFELSNRDDYHDYDYLRYRTVSISWMPSTYLIMSYWAFSS